MDGRTSRAEPSKSRTAQQSGIHMRSRRLVIGRPRESFYLRAGSRGRRCGCSRCPPPPAAAEASWCRPRLAGGRENVNQIEGEPYVPRGKAKDNTGPLSLRSIGRATCSIRRTWPGARADILSSGGGARRRNWPTTNSSFAVSEIQDGKRRRSGSRSRQAKSELSSLHLTWPRSFRPVAPVRAPRRRALNSITSTLAPFFPLPSSSSRLTG